MRSPRSRRHGERGAAATIVAVLAVMGVLLGVLAISVDVGRVYLERRELQNGADAGALAAAQVCGEDTSGCTTTNLRAEIEALVNANAKDAAGHEVSSICGPLVGTTCPPASLTDLAVCPPLPVGFSGDYLEVHTRTRSSEGSFISNVFGGAIGGASESTVGACARAALGSPAFTGETLPLAIRDCNWEQATTATPSRERFAPVPPYSRPKGNSSSPLPDEVKPYVTHIVAHAEGNPSDNSCDTGGIQSMYAPGAFGWLKDLEGNDDCKATFTAEGNLIGNPGAAPPNGCKGAGMKYWLGKQVLVPIFTEVVKTGGDTVYTVSGLSSFYVAGYKDLTGGVGTDSVYSPTGATMTNLCKNWHKNFPNDVSKMQDADCVWGWFTSPLLPVGTVSPTAPDRGPTVIQLAG